VGKATVVDGVQIVNIAIKDGVYSPNKVTVKAGVPVTVTFAGPAKDCVGKPKFAALNKQVDIRSAGTGTMELGSLTAGVYAFTCGMGANAGSITAQ
jgi:plastocyanin domain-containing protein